MVGAAFLLAEARRPGSGKLGDDKEYDSNSATLLIFALPYEASPE